MATTPTPNPANPCNMPFGNDKVQCPPGSTWDGCRPWSLEEDPVNCLAEDLVDEGLQIGGVTINIHKLLGVHEQEKLVDKTGKGRPISSGDMSNFPASNAFTTKKTEWRSWDGGQALVSSGFIGYDFGAVVLPNGRVQYGVDANIRYNIASIRIKQGNDAKNRVTKARIERSDDGKVWYGVEIVNLPNDNKLNLITFRASVPSRYWRIRPVQFDGEACDSWAVQALELFEQVKTREDNIQDMIWMENRSREYDQNAIALKGYYTPFTKSAEINQWNYGNVNEYTIRFSFRSCVAQLGRPIVVGDILELPNEAMFTPTMERQRLFLEVKSVAWDAEGTQTPGWQYTMLSVRARIAMHSEETQDIYGDLVATIDESGLSDLNDGNSKVSQDFADVSQYIEAVSKTAVPERGANGSSAIRAFSEEEAEAIKETPMKQGLKTGLRRRGLYVQDAMPPNGAPFTEGPSFPEHPRNKDYHRLTYEGSAKDIPARLFRWSDIKNDWIYQQTDMRYAVNNQKMTIEEFLVSPGRQSPRTPVSNNNGT